MTKTIKRIEVENENGQVIRVYTTLREFTEDSEKRSKDGWDLCDDYPYIVYSDNSGCSITFSGELI